MKALPAILAAMLLTMPALADNHGTGDAPWCHEAAAQQSPVCRVYDGDIPAQPDLGPWQGTDRFPRMNVIVLEPGEQPTMTPRRSRQLFDEGEAVEIRLVATPPVDPECDTLFCDGGAPEHWCEDWWCSRHSSRPGQDEDRQAPDRDIAANDPPARSEPPEDREPSREETRSPMSSDNEREVQDRADRRQRDRDRQNAMMHGD